MDIKEFARLGGKARMKALTKKQRRELALKGVAGRRATKVAKRSKKNVLDTTVAF